MNIIIIILLSFFSLVATANDCNSPSPGKLDGTLRSEVDTKPLTIKQREKIVRFLNRLYKDRDGTASGYVCKKGKVQVSSDGVRLREKSQNKNSYKLHVSFKRKSDHVFGSEIVAYSVSKNRLYSGWNGTGFETVVKKVSSNEIILLEKSRFNRTMIREVVRHYSFGRDLTVTNTYYVNGILRGKVKWMF